MAITRWNGMTMLGRARSRVSSNWHATANLCPCCTNGLPRLLKPVDRRLARHAEKRSWQAEADVDLRAEEQETLDYALALVHGEHPMEDDIDRALGVYPGTHVEHLAVPSLRVPIRIRT